MKDGRLNFTQLRGINFRGWVVTVITHGDCLLKGRVEKATLAGNCELKLTLASLEQINHATFAHAQHCNLIKLQKDFMEISSEDGKIVIVYPTMCLTLEPAAVTATV
jgi:hypothetical protein